VTLQRAAAADEAVLIAHRDSTAELEARFLHGL
jgi:hypothetical protein